MRQARSGFASPGVSSDKTRRLYKDLRKQNTAASCSFTAQRFLSFDVHFKRASNLRIIK